MSEMPSAPASSVQVTDHALLCWLERVHLIDIEAIRTEIATACERGAALRAPCIRVLGARFFLRGKTIVTCVSDDRLVDYEVLVEFARHVEVKPDE